MQYLDPRLPERFWNKTIPEPNSGCWLWTGRLNEDEYAKYDVWDEQSGRSRARFAHRVAWEALTEAVANELDHICSTRCCVNPNHLEPVTHQENVARGRAGEPQARRTHCPKGHPYDETNTLWCEPSRHHPRGQRMCRTCRRDRDRDTKRAPRALKKAA